MRARRSAKLAEYLSTYAILNTIGLHETALLERRDASIGVGLYVHDACDADTTLLVVPSHRACSCSVLRDFGAAVPLTLPSQDAAASGINCMFSTLQDGLITHLLGCEVAAEWVEWGWRTALERSRAHSPLWGWLQSVPSLTDYADATEQTRQHCRVHHTALLADLEKGLARIALEKRAAYDALRETNLMPTFACFDWAVETLLTRGLRVPECWAATAPALTSACGIELAVLPLVDLVNGVACMSDSQQQQAANARLEVASTTSELPSWYVTWVQEESARRGDDAMRRLQWQMQAGALYCICLTLSANVGAGSQVLLSYDVPSLVTDAPLVPHDNMALAQLLRYKY